MILFCKVQGANYFPRSLIREYYDKQDPILHLNIIYGFRLLFDKLFSQRDYKGEITVILDKYSYRTIVYDKQHPILCVQCN